MKNAALDRAGKNAALKNATPRRYWTTFEVRALRALYSSTTNKELGARLNRAPKAIALMALELGLRKSPAHIALHCRYQHGHATWNKGKQWSAPGSHGTWFKKGHRGARQRPVGSERRTRDGWEVKVAEPRSWIAKPRLVWQEHFGEIPVGAIVRCRNGNVDNCAPDNLLLITRAENLRLNWKPRGPAKKEVVRWIAPLKMAA